MPTRLHRAIIQSKSQWHDKLFGRGAGYVWGFQEHEPHTRSSANLTIARSVQMRRNLNKEINSLRDSIILKVIKQRSNKFREKHCFFFFLFQMSTTVNKKVNEKKKGSSIFYRHFSCIQDRWGLFPSPEASFSSPHRLPAHHRANTMRQQAFTLTPSI